MFSGNNPNGEGFNSLKQFGFGMHNSTSGAATATTLRANGAGSSSGAIDWAQLAQQWIQMRDTNAAAGADLNLETQGFCLPAAPPPPPIISTMPSYKATLTTTTTATTTKHNKHHHSSYEEQGEADMEMDEENESDKCTEIPPAAPIITQQQWYGVGGDGNSGLEPGTNHHSPQWNMWPPRVNVPPPPVISNAALSAAAAAGNPTAHIPSLLKINVTNPNAPIPYSHVNSVVGVCVATPAVVGNTQSGNGTEVPYCNNSGIDANKRKMLPAWIREGLEKMEREKQKQMERQQQPKGKDSSNYDDYEITRTTASHPNPLNHSPPVNLLQNIANSASESESGNESEDHHTDNYDDRDYGAAVHRSTSHSSLDRNELKQQRNHHHHHHNRQQQQQSNDLIGKSYEQKLADLMFVVRRTLTELLLETTNEEIANVAHDVIKAHRKKASSAQVIRKSALSSITGKLGLAAYADSSSDDNSADDSDNEDYNDDINNRAVKKSDNYDSGEDLKATIRNKKRAFAKTIEEIEKNIAQAEEREEQQIKYFKQLEKERAASDTQKRKYDNFESNKRSTGGRGSGSSGSNSKSTNNDFGERTTTTTDSKLKHQFNGKRMNRKERTTRFSDNKDGKNTNASAYNAAATSYISHLQQQQQQSAITTTINNSAGCGVGGLGASNSNQQQQKSMPVPNPATALLQMPESIPHYTAAAITNSGIANMLNAADAALEKAAAKQTSKLYSSLATVVRGRHKKKSSRSHRRRRRSNRRSSDESSSSSSNSSTVSEKNKDSDDGKSSRSSSRSSSSHQSKHSSRASSSKHQSHHQQRRSYHGSSNSKYEKGSKDRDHDYERRHDRERRHRDRSHERYAATKGSNSSNSSRNHRRYSTESDDDDYRSSSRRHNQHDKRRSRTRSRSRSRSHSNYSSSRSSQRRRH